MITQNKMSFVQSAKDCIDHVVNNKSIFVHKHKTCMNLSTLCYCLPCITCSIIIRIIACPLQCLINKHTACNPITSCIVQSPLSQQSDTCIFNYMKECEKDVRIKYSFRITKDEIDEIMIYASKEIKKTNDIKLKYMISDCVSGLLHLKDVTPDYITSTYQT